MDRLSNSKHSHVKVYWESSITRRYETCAGRIAYYKALTGWLSGIGQDISFSEKKEWFCSRLQKWKILQRWLWEAKDSSTAILMKVWRYQPDGSLKQILFILYVSENFESFTCARPFIAPIRRKCVFMEWSIHANGCRWNEKRKVNSWIGTDFPHIC